MQIKAWAGSKAERAGGLGRKCPLQGYGWRGKSPAPCPDCPFAKKRDTFPCLKTKPDSVFRSWLPRAP